MSIRLSVPQCHRNKNKGTLISDPTKAIIPPAFLGHKPFSEAPDCSRAMALHSGAGIPFRWSVIEYESTLVFLKAINILLCADFYLHHLDSSSLIKSCDLYKQNCCSLTCENYKN